jgi:hypothetical protein
MKALTLWQPWATIVVHCGKDIENRPWAPPYWIINHRIAIHAGKVYDEDVFVGLLSVFSDEKRHEIYQRSHKVRGAILGTAVVRGFVTESDSPWFCGPFGWQLSDVLPLKEPIPCRGAQKLWNVPGSIAIQIVKEQNLLEAK